jgi:hypothetical protein
MKLPLAMLAVALTASPVATAQQSIPPQGPSVPPSLRSPPPYTPASGQDLRDEAMRKLQRQFDQADVDRNGSLTRTEAKRAGLGFVERSFDDIATPGRDRVSFSEVRGFMAERARAARKER